MRLGKCAEFIMGQAPHSNTYNDNGVGSLLIKAGDFQELYPTPKEYTTNPISFSKEGDVLICVVGATAGKVNLGIEASITRSIAAIRPNKNLLDDKFLFFFLKYNYFKINNMATGSAQAIISKPVLSNLDIPDLKLEEQNAIATILTKVETLISKRQKSIDLLDEFVKSVFHEMFGDPMRNEKVFKTERIGKFTSTITTEKPKQNTEKQYSYIDISSINNKKIEKVKIVDGFDAPSRARQIVGINDILVSTVRPNLNTVSIITENYHNPIASTGFCVLRSNNINHYYLFSICLSQYFINELEKQVKGSNYPAVSDKDVKDVLIPIPPIDLQNQFASIVEKVEELKKQYKASLDELENLFGSLSQKAFKGELDLRGITVAASLVTNSPIKIEKLQKPLKKKKPRVYSGLIETDEDYKNWEKLIEAGFPENTTFEAADDSEMRIFLKEALKGNTIANKVLWELYSDTAIKIISSDNSGLDAHILKNYRLSIVEKKDLFSNILNESISDILKTKEEIDDGFLYEIINSNIAKHVYYKYIEKVNTITDQDVKKYVLPAIAKTDVLLKKEKINNPLLHFAYNLPILSSHLTQPLINKFADNNTLKEAAVKSYFTTKEYQIITNQIEEILITLAKKIIDLELLKVENSPFLLSVFSNSNINWSNIIDDGKKSIWQSTRNYGQIPDIEFNEIEGIAILEELQKNNIEGFTFKTLDSFLKQERFKYNYKDIQQFVFKLLEEKKLVQRFLSTDLNQRKLQLEKNNSELYFGDEEIWLRYQKNN